ncbi:MAG: hypothetical protein A2W91_07860 [Bacteroidetes bacterium GWF2_38_335]|nr:MAG: hypothetical protein A2W91_07860 [Bacteroidetes bacterium GWF2_38_335]OFY79033.1 MAG: hypothetical protein A2281_02860 [Bacteroidetes bacterium RIFOXYA12_FULL_38_20]HBS86113.1 hypothetical protein [Bacteroidales bacterium]
MQNKIWLIYLVTSLAMLIWGLSYIWVDVALDYYSAATIASVRVFIATAFMISLALITGKLEKVRKKDLKLFMMFGFFDPFCYFLCESYGIDNATPTSAAVIIATIPLLTPVSAFLILKEKLSIINILGIIVSFSGVILVVVTQNFNLAIEPAGLFLLTGAVICAIFYNFFLRNLAGKYNLYTVISVQNIFACIYFLPVFLIHGIPDMSAVKLNTEIAVTMIALSILASALAFIFYANGIKFLGITKANVFANMIPVFAAVFSYLLLDEILELHQFIGIAVVIAGVFLSQTGVKNQLK